MLGERHDRHRRERGDDRWGDRAAAGGRIFPARPLLWLAVKLWRAVLYAGHRTAYGYLGTSVGRFALGGAALYVSASSVWGAAWMAYLGYWSLWLTGAAGFCGAYAYRRRITWEQRVRNAVYHVIPGHSRVEPEVVWFGAPGLPARLNLGRWTGSWDFGFRLPPGAREADLGDLAEHLRERLPAAHGASWMVRWDLRTSTAQVTLVSDMPNSLTRAEMLARLEMQEQEGSV